MSMVCLNIVTWPRTSFFYRKSYLINLWCYIFIVLTTYMLFISQPCASDLLLNVIALQFLINIDDELNSFLLDDGVKEHLKQKFLLSYIQNGEKTPAESEKTSNSMGTMCCKLLCTGLCGVHSAYLAALLYYACRVLAFVLVFCMV